MRRIAEHPVPDVNLPVANIILDRARFSEDDGIPSEDFFDYASVGVLGIVDDALGAAGYQTVLTYDRPWEGGVSELTYILTAGGNEDTGDGLGMGPPYWTNAQDLGAELMELLDLANHPGPVFVHPICGLPDSGRWRDVRTQFGLPPRFSFTNQALSQDKEYRTSLLTSLPVAEEADATSEAMSIVPTTGTVLGRTMNLRLPYEQGQLIDITVYDLRSQPVSELRAVPYSEPLQGTLDKYSLMVIEPAR